MLDDLRPLIFGFAFVCAFLVGGVHAAETCVATTAGGGVTGMAHPASECCHAP